MFHIFFRSLCSWWDFLPKNNRTPQLYFVYLLRLTCLKKKTDKQLQTLTLQPNSLLHSHSGWSHARWRGVCMTPGYKGEQQPTRFNSMKFALSKKYQSGQYSYPFHATTIALGHANSQCSFYVISFTYMYMTTDSELKNLRVAHIEIYCIITDPFFVFYRLAVLN